MKNLHIALGCLSMAALVAGCSGGSGGSHGSSESNYDSLAAQYATLETELAVAKEETVEMPTEATATYTGVAAFSSAEGGDAYGALTLTANFDDSTISGDISDLTFDDEAIDGTLFVTNGEITGTDFIADVDGELTDSEGMMTFEGEMTGAFSGATAGMVSGTIDGTLGGTETITGDFIAKQ